MAKKTLKLILDTNLWVSFLISKNYIQLDEIIFVKKAKIIFSRELLEEFLSVVKRRKFRRFFSNEDIRELLETIQEHSEFIEVKSVVEMCRDKRDNFLLALAKDSEADYLITGDTDLLILEKMGKTKISTITKFFEAEG